MLFLIALISAELFGMPKKKLNKECIIPLLACLGPVLSRVEKMLSIRVVNWVICHLQSISSFE